jgi:hypothetical protein
MSTLDITTYDRIEPYGAIFLKIVFAIPVCISVFIMVSYFCVGMGVIVPYMFLADEYGFGFQRTLIFGTLFHIVNISIFWIAMKFDYHDVVYYAFTEMVIGMILAYGISTGFSW